MAVVDMRSWSTCFPLRTRWCSGDGWEEVGLVSHPNPPESLPFNSPSRWLIDPQEVTTLSSNHMIFKNIGDFYFANSIQPTTFLAP